MAIGVALLAGIVSFASPCVLPLVPGYVGYLGGLTGQSATGPKGGALPETKVRGSVTGRVLLGTFLFVLGFTAVFVTLGVAFSALGVRLHAHMDLIMRILGAIVIVMGVAFLGHIPFLQRDTRFTITPRLGIAGAPLLGATFALGWSPCIGPTLAAVLALSFGGGEETRGAVLAIAYCIGLGLPFIAIAVGFTRSSKMLDWVRKRRQAITKFGGWMLIVLGILLVSGLWVRMMNWLQGIIASFGTPI